jgi:WD40 repeat protein
MSLVLLGCKEQQRSPLDTWQRSAQGTVAAAVRDGGGFSLVAGFDEPAGWWDNSKGGRLFNWRLPKEPVLLVAISPDGSVAATASSHSFATWDTTTGKNLGYFTTPKSQLEPSGTATLRSLALSDRGRHVALALADGRAVVIDLKTGRRLEFLGHQLAARKEGIPDGWAGVNAIDISPNGRYVLSGGDDHQALFWDAKTGQLLHAMPMGARVNLVRMDTAHKRLFSASVKAEAFLWDAVSGKELARLALKPRDYVLSSVAFSADGKRLATGAPGRDVWVWSAADGRQLDHWKISAARKRGAVVLALAFSGSDRLITESSTGLAERWAIDSPPE